MLAKTRALSRMTEDNTRGGICHFKVKVSGWVARIGFLDKFPLLSSMYGRNLIKLNDKIRYLKYPDL